MSSSSNNVAAWIGNPSIKNSNNVSAAQTVIGTGGGPCPPPTPSWITLAEYDLTSVDTMPGVTTTGGDISLTVGAAPFITLKNITGSGTGTITPTNGTGIIFNVTNTRGVHIEPNWTALGVDPSLDVIGIMHEWSFTSILDGGAIVPMLVTANSGFTTNFSAGARWNRTTTSRSINARFYNSSANISPSWTSFVGEFSGTYTGVTILTPSGVEVRAAIGGLTDPPSFTYAPRRFSISQGWTTSALNFPAGPPKAAFGVDGAVCAWRKVRLIKWGAV